MKNAQDADCYLVCSVSGRLAELFAQVMDKGQVAFIDWQELMTAPLTNSFTQDDEDLITRLIYAVRTGLVKVVDER
jgi:hypothetical protein